MGETAAQTVEVAAAAVAIVVAGVVIKAVVIITVVIIAVVAMLPVLIAVVVEVILQLPGGQVEGPVLRVRKQLEKVGVHGC